MGLVRSILQRFVGAPPRIFRVAEGSRVFAIGDVHGRLDLLDHLLALIAAERSALPRQQDHIIFLGDLIDRGPDSRGVIDRLLAIRDTLPNPVFLAGNHEEMLLRILDGEGEEIPNWMRFGGQEMAESYGIDPFALIEAGPQGGIAMLAAAIPAAHQQFLRDMADSFAIGDYWFVHAGVRPGVALAEQAPSDMRWIRQEFLSSNADFGALVVHGHTVFLEPDVRPNRIGIDTGAYASGVLTALCIDGAERRFLSTPAE